MNKRKNSKPDALRNLSPRSVPVQQRAQQRRDEILAVTAQLLEDIGLDDLTTIKVAKSLGISVGTLYHYFPNKHAILYALAEHWLGEMDAALQRLGEPQTSQSLRQFVDQSINQLLKVYTDQSGLLPLVQAMFGIPELKELDERHDMLVIDFMSAQFLKLDLGDNEHGLRRLARTWLELTHALLLVAVNQNKEDSAKTLAELKHLCLALLERSRGQF